MNEEAPQATFCHRDRFPFVSEYIDGAMILFLRTFEYHKGNNDIICILFVKQCALKDANKQHNEAEHHPANTRLDTVSRPLHVAAITLRGKVQTSICNNKESKVHRPTHVV